MSNIKSVYLDDSNTIEMRVKDLLERMTLKEKFREIGMYSSRYFLGGMRFSKRLAEGFFKGAGIGALEDPPLLPEKNAIFINELQKYMIENTRLGIPTLFIS